MSAARWARLGAALVVAALTITCLFALQNWIAFGLIDRGAPWTTLWLRELPLWSCWALCVPVIVALVRGTKGWRLGPRLSAHLLCASACHVFVMLVCGWFTGELDPSALRFTLVRSAGTQLLIYAIIASVTIAVDQARAAQRSAELEAELARARLDQLRARLRPHFLFNTLNTAVALARRDPDATACVLVDLAALLRRCLSVDEGVVPLREELEFCGSYLAIQRHRFGKRLQVELALDPALGDLAVPALCLQPLLENAIKHGLQDDRPLRLTIRATRSEGDRVRIEVADNGHGLSLERCEAIETAMTTRRLDVREGLGLRGTAARLQVFAGPSARISLRPGSRGGLVAALDLPHRLHGSAPTVSPHEV